jgi:starch synthase (maltosyl-transferring)
MMTTEAAQQRVDADRDPREPVRLAFCITELDAGGAERALAQLVRGLDRSAWQSRVYCLGPPGPFASLLQDDGIPVQCLNAVHLWDAPRIVWQLQRAFRQWKPALLQTFLFHANILGRLAGRWAGVPRVVCGQRVAERRNSWYGRIDRWTSGCVDRNVCVSLGVATFCEDVVGLPAKKTVVIPNGVEVPRFTTATPVDWTAFGISAGAQVLITIGRLEPQKGVDLLLAAFESVARQFPAVHLAIAGDGPDRRMLEAQAQRMNLSSRVTFLGRRDDVPRLLAGSTGLVLASRWEGMPNAVLEAMAAARPVIATRVEGTPELVTPGETGWLVPPDNSVALSTAMIDLLSDGEHAAQLGRNSQAIVQSRFTIDAMVAAYDQLYRELLRNIASTRR